MAKDKRPKFLSKEVSYLGCEPANYDHDKGEPSTVITLAHLDDIEPIVLSLDDSRRLAAQLLVALFTNDDKFAEKVLQAHFPHDKRGYYYWPREDGSGA